MKYVDAEKLKRFVESIGLTPQKSADYNDGRNDVKMMVLDFIDSLQQEQPKVDKVDLEKEIEAYFKDWSMNSYDAFFNEDGYKVSMLGIKNIARHFYELGLKRAAEMYDNIEYNKQRAEED